MEDLVVILAEYEGSEVVSETTMRTFGEREETEQHAQGLARTLTEKKSRRVIVKTVRPTSRDEKTLIPVYWQ